MSTRPLECGSCNRDHPSAVPCPEDRPKRTRARRPSYRTGVAWIAENDADGDKDALEIEAVSGYISTLLLADLFGKCAEEVAADVVLYRARARIAEGGAGQ